MNRSEKWTSPEEIKKVVCEPLEYASGSGPTAWYENNTSYIISGEQHISVEGLSGIGKTQSIIEPTVACCALKKESILITDVKGEIIKDTYGHFSKDYQIFVYDFRDPYNSPCKFNILLPMYLYYKSSDPSENDIASTMMHEFVDGLLADNMTDERYWTDSSHDLLIGLLLVMFDEARSIDEVNLDSLVNLMEQMETRKGITTTIKTVYDRLPADSLAKRFLSTYATCSADDTRGCIKSVAAAAINGFSRSRGLMSISCDGGNFLDIDYDRPAVIYMLLPDETKNHVVIVSSFITQFVQNLIRVAQNKGGRLKIPWTLCLDEIASIGKCIPLGHLAVASRSRGIRLCMCWQSAHSQLEALYGKNIAESIYSCIGTTFLFSTNNFSTLNEWAERCGVRYVEDENGRLTGQSLITPTQLYSMGKGTCLCITSQYKFITHLPMHKDMYDCSGWKPLALKPAKIRKKHKVLELFEVADRLNRQYKGSNDAAPWNRTYKEENDFGKVTGIFDPEPLFPVIDFNPSSYDDSDFREIEDEDSRTDEMLEEIISQITRDYEERKKEEEEKQNQKEEIVVSVSCESGKIDETARFIARNSKVSFSEAKRKLKSECTVKVAFDIYRDAVEFVCSISSIGPGVFARVDTGR